MTSLTSVRSSSLRSRSVVVGAFHSRGRSRASRASAARSASVIGAGRACSSAVSLPRSRSTVGEGVLERSFEGAGDESVLGLARVELAARAVGFELGALDGEALPGEQLVVLVLQLADRAGGGRDPGRGHGFQERGGDGLRRGGRRRATGRSARWHGARGRAGTHSGGRSRWFRHS